MNGLALDSIAGWMVSNTVLPMNLCYEIVVHQNGDPLVSVLETDTSLEEAVESAKAFAEANGSFDFFQIFEGTSENTCCILRGAYTREELLS
jgi:hypothetical protein